MRFFLTIEYDGSEYIGWQRQNSGLSVQEVVENSIYKIVQINAMKSWKGNSSFYATIM